MERARIASGMTVISLGGEIASVCQFHAKFVIPHGRLATVLLPIGSVTLLYLRTDSRSRCRVGQRAFERSTGIANA
jgi:hypothetical protein